MPLPERILMDTSAFYALVSATDDFHEQARHTFTRLVDREQELWTTSYILVETVALVHRRLGFEALQTFGQSIDEIVRVFWVGSGVHREAWKQLATERGVGFSFVDWTTALAARWLRAHVFTFDQGFPQRGIAVIPR